jgi:hypothetical protein
VEPERTRSERSERVGTTVVCDVVVGGSASTGSLAATVSDRFEDGADVVRLVDGPPGGGGVIAPVDRGLLAERLTASEGREVVTTLDPSVVDVGIPVGPVGGRWWLEVAGVVAAGGQALARVSAPGDRPWAAAASATLARLAGCAVFLTAHPRATRRALVVADALERR